MEVSISLPNRSDFEIRQEGYMSQHLAANDDKFTKLYGSDRELSDSIGMLLVLGEHKIINMKDPNVKLMMDLLDVLRKSHFATNPTNSNVTTLGFGLPLSPKVYDGKKDG